MVLKMTDIIEKQHLKNFVPFQHELRVAQTLDKIVKPPSEELDVQASNVKNILSNALDITDYRTVQKGALIPDNIMENMYNDFAQTQLDKKLQEMRGVKFGIEFEEVMDVDMDLNNRI